MKKYMKGIALLLIVAIAITSAPMNVNAAIEDMKISEFVYVDGQEFEVVTDVEKGIVKVNAVGNGNTCELVVSEIGAGVATVVDEKEDELVEYTLEIEDLSEKNIEIDILDENGEIVEEIDQYEDLIADVYDGQVAATVTVVSVITVETLITALLASAACIAVAGVIYYAGKAVAAEIQKSKEKQSYYYKAYIYNKNVFVNLANRISRESAIARIKKGKNYDVYTFSKSRAKSVTVAAGLGCTSPEISCFSGKKVKFYHYHTANRNGAHVFYGIPVIS